MICTNKKCAVQIPDGAKYCPMCGRRQTAERDPARHKYHTRANGSGTAFRRGKTWTARVVIGWRTVDGKALPIYRSRGGFSTKREALEYCPTLKSAGYRPDESAPKLATYWESYEKVKLPTLSASKQTAYRGAWRKLSPLHYLPVDKIGAAILMETVQAVATSYYPARDCKTVLTRLFEMAAADGWCSKDIPSFIQLPKLEEREREVFTDVEQAALWRLYESGDIRAAIPLLMICTGMMPGEMQALKVEHIDLDGHQIHGVGMKTKVRKASPIYLPDDTLPMVEDLIAHAQKSGYIWPHSEDLWYASYYAALEAAGCRRLEPYCCRHSTATRLAITEGIAPQTIKRMMRWSTTKMLDRYAHPDDQAVRDAANTITKR